MCSNHFWLFTLPVLAHHINIKHWNKRQKWSFSADYQTLQQATGHHHKNDRVHIGNCHPAGVKHPQQTLPPPQPCVLSCSVHTIHSWLQLQTMRDIHHNAEIRGSTMESSSDWQNQQSCRFLCWHNRRLLFENETEAQIDVLSLSITKKETLAPLSTSKGGEKEQIIITLRPPKIRWNQHQENLQQTYISELLEKRKK